MAALLVPTEGVGAAKEPPLLEPSGPWMMNYADDSCHLARAYGTGDDAIIIEFRQFAPSRVFELLIAGKKLKAGRARPLTTQFEPNGKPRKHPSSLQGKLADGRVVFETSVRLPDDEYDTDDPDESGHDWKADFESLAPLEANHDAEARITQLRISGPLFQDVRFRLGPLDKPLDAMRACLDELLTHWGIDAAAHHSLTRRAVPTSDPGRWLGPADYPTELLKKNESGVVHMRLMVDAQGKPTKCVVQTGGSEFDKVTCALLMRRARFSPALDAQGKPIASYYTNSVRWLS
jgi:hypothetical protein